MNAEPQKRFRADYEVDLGSGEFDAVACPLRADRMATARAARPRSPLLPVACPKTACVAAVSPTAAGRPCPLVLASKRSTTQRGLRGGLEFHRLRRVLRYIEEHLAEDLSRDVMAGVACLSRQHFAASFNVTMGVSPHRYLIQRRVLRSQALLLSTDETITAIAYAVGFSSHGHFTTYFRQLTGTTPSHFRAHGQRCRKSS